MLHCNEVVRGGRNISPRIRSIGLLILIAIRCIRIHDIIIIGVGNFIPHFRKRNIIVYSSDHQTIKLIFTLSCAGAVQIKHSLELVMTKILTGKTYIQPIRLSVDGTRFPMGIQHQRTRFAMISVIIFGDETISQFRKHFICIGIGRRKRIAMQAKFWIHQRIIAVKRRREFLVAFHARCNRHIPVFIGTFKEHTILDEIGPRIAKERLARRIFVQSDVVLQRSGFYIELDIFLVRIDGKHFAMNRSRHVVVEFEQFIVRIIDTDNFIFRRESRSVFELDFKLYVRNRREHDTVFAHFEPLLFGFTLTELLVNLELALLGFYTRSDGKRLGVANNTISIRSPLIGPHGIQRIHVFRNLGKRIEYAESRKVKLFKDISTVSLQSPAGQACIRTTHDIERNQRIKIGSRRYTVMRTFFILLKSIDKEHRLFIVIVYIVCKVSIVQEQRSADIFN